MTPLVICANLRAMAERLGNVDKNTLIEAAKLIEKQHNLKPAKSYPSGEGTAFRQRFMLTPNKEFRAPKRGEWYLSGAIPHAYQAKADFTETSAYYILIPLE